MDSKTLFVDGVPIDKAPKNATEWLDLLVADGNVITRTRECLEKQNVELQAASHRDASQIRERQADLKARDQDAQLARAESAQTRENLEKQNVELRAAMIEQLQTTQTIGTMSQAIGNMMLNSFGQSCVQLQSARAETVRLRDCLEKKTECLEKKNGELQASSHRDAKRILELVSQTNALKTDLKARDKDIQLARAESDQARECLEKHVADLHATAQHNMAGPHALNVAQSAQTPPMWTRNFRDQVSERRLKRCKLLQEEPG